MFFIGICDDEIGTCAELEKIIEQFAEQHKLEIQISIWYTGESLCQYLEQENNLDLLFLDIVLDELSGIEVGNFIREKLINLKTSIIFISQWSQYALNLFRIQPIDFLIKPITNQKVLDVMEFWKNRYIKDAQLLEIKTGRTFYKIPYNDIMYLYSDNKKVNIKTFNGQIQFYGKLKNISATLPKNFISIHQSYVINLNYIKESSYHEVKMMDDQYFNISQVHRKKVRETIVKTYKEKKNV